MSLNFKARSIEFLAQPGPLFISYIARPGLARPVDVGSPPVYFQQVDLQL